MASTSSFEEVKTDTDGFEKVVGTSKKVRKQRDHHQHVNPQTNHRHLATTSKNNGKNKSAKPSSFGQSKWAKPNIVINKTDRNCTEDSNIQVPPSTSSPSPSPEESDGQNIKEPGTIAEEPQVYRQEEALDSVSAGEKAFDFQAAATTQPLSSLLADYGEQDLDWKKIQVPIAQDATGQEWMNESEEASNHLEAPSATTTNTNTGVSNSSNNNKNKKAFESRLGSHGKAPIHVEFVSFGYHHGAPPPADLHSHDGLGRYASCSPQESLLTTSTIDTRILLHSSCKVPPYLAWRDGLSGAVKYALLFAAAPGGAGDSGDNGGGGGDGVESKSIRKLSQELATQTGNALVEAINEGGYGYVSPLHCKIFIGSDTGRHRSVVVAEMAAIALRNLLRSNSNNRFACPCSVGTRHRDIERNKNCAQQDKNAKLKQKDLESDDV